ncbi:nucleobase-ascorbate transporter 7 [Cajanus cajan]|uniref:nucleobase-ascorbate transporter 7 n=1 Tax=Cajanus cajan TaxID=3821 RepID=UPI00098D9198|nr:nucleobase-ascorbate transporter 7 [Cajanus cajan]XP_020236298.1 nucleobase-ascorbate transporter 7 [Cajanus cajan]
MMTPLVASLSCAPISANSFFSASVSLNVSIQQPQPQSNSMAYIYIPHVMKGEKPIVYRFAVLFSVTIVWIYAHLLSVGGAYKNVPQTTQDTCRIDRVGIISSAPWYASATPLPPSVLSCGVD